MNKIALLFGVLLLCSCSQNMNISTIQNDEKSFENTYITVTGIVSGDFQDKGELAGFFLQEDALFSSSGIFVHSYRKVNLGDEISITAKVIEYKNETRLDSVMSLEILSQGNTVNTQTLSFPFSEKSIEKLEGCLVEVENEMLVSDSYSFDKYGQILISLNPLVQATEIYDAQNEASEIIKLNSIQTASSIRLDDLSNSRFPKDSSLYIARDKLVIGAKINNIKGYLTQKNETYSIRLVSELIAELPQTKMDSYESGKLTVMSFNLHNLFNGNGLGEGFPTARGAKTHELYLTQLQKLASAISLSNPAIIAIMEIENDGEDSLSTISQLCSYLNIHTQRSTYEIAFSNGKAANDVIKTAILYDSEVVNTIDLASYQSAKVYSRSPLFQKFSFQDSLEFVLSVNHFKSKSPRGAKGDNVDMMDGQAAYNAKRVLQAETFNTIIDSLYPNENLIVVGDFNAYSMEDPIQELASSRLDKVSTSNYSYVYMGKQGCLDHVFVTDTFSKYIRSVNSININAAYPNWIDYRFENSDSSYLRSSDHNPLVIEVY